MTALWGLRSVALAKKATQRPTWHALQTRLQPALFRTPR